MRLPRRVVADFDTFMRQREATTAALDAEGTARLRMLALIAGVDPARVRGVDTDRSELIVAAPDAT